MVPTNDAADDSILADNAAYDAWLDAHYAESSADLDAACYGAVL